MEKYQQQLYVTPTGPVVSIVATTAATTTTTSLRAGLYYITNSVDVYLNVDSDAVKEVQNVLVTPAVGNVYALTVDGVVITSAALVAATYADLVTKLQADVDYATALFTIAANGAGTGITVTWKEIGAIATLGSLVETEAAISATETLAGDAATAEVQNIAVTPVVGSVYTLTVGAVALTSAALAAATLADLVTKLQADADYAAAPFTIAEDVGVGITITWKATGVVAGLATISAVEATINATETLAGDGATAEIQDIATTAVSGYTYTLVSDGVTLTSAALSASTLGDLVTKLQADGDYAGASFTIAENVGVGITITFKAVGAVGTLGSLVATTNTISATETTPGDAGVAEVQDIAVTPVSGGTYTLVSDGVTLTSAALTASTIADLITKLQADGDYAGASFTIAANGAIGITITFKAVGPVATLGTLTTVRAAVAATEVTAGVDGVATSSNMFLTAGDRIFDIPQGTWISCLRAGASDGVVSITGCS